MLLDPISVGHQQADSVVIIMYHWYITNQAWCMTVGKKTRFYGSRQCVEILASGDFVFRQWQRPLCEVSPPEQVVLYILLCTNCCNRMSVLRYFLVYPSSSADWYREVIIFSQFKRNGYDTCTHYWIPWCLVMINTGWDTIRIKA